MSRRLANLHLDIELPAGLIACLDIQDGELVIFRFLRIEGIQQVNVANLMAGRPVQDAVHQVNQNGTRDLSAEQVLECVIHLGVDFHDHESISLKVDFQSGMAERY
jgi:hypothetical protein